MSFRRQSADTFLRSSDGILPQGPFRSLFPLADIAVKRGNRNRKRPLQEPSKESNHSFSSIRRRSLKEKLKKSNVPVLTEKLFSLNATDMDVDENSHQQLNSYAFSPAPPKLTTTSLFNMSIAEESTMSEKFSRARKVLSLAAHGPSLPKIASPLSPRFQTCSLYRHVQASDTSPYSPRPGRTQASLDLTKSHWEVRYENWVESLGRQHRMELCSIPTAATAMTELMRSRLPNVSLNPAIFPRAGSLLSKGEGDFTVLIDRDCASRGWSMDKIQRELFLHDMEIRLFFPARNSTLAKRNRDVSIDFRSSRRWEWDWDLKWSIIRNLAFEASRARLEREYDDFLGNDLEALQLEIDFVG